MTFNQSIVVDAAPAALFRLTQDYDLRLEWDPFLRSARLIGNAREPGVGVRALCVAKNGWAMETEYVVLSAVGHRGQDDTWALVSRKICGRLALRRNRAGADASGLPLRPASLAEVVVLAPHPDRLTSLRPGYTQSTTGFEGNRRAAGAVVQGGRGRPTALTMPAPVANSRCRTGFPGPLPTSQGRR